MFAFRQLESRLHLQPVFGSCPLCRLGMTDVSVVKSSQLEKYFKVPHL